ncbi:hypothetical protein ACK3YP_12300 [Aeromonas allosaccharophila]|uniref:hypothetical protein n=1 Tax=Aeromonas allosaccharophila TaxID=656 RepID=UPI003987F809
MKKKQSLLFSFDQIMDSGLVFLFIAIGGNLLNKTEMASVVLAQSISLVCILFCSCFTTQYLLLRYKDQSHLYWTKVFLFFFIITSGIVFFWSDSLLILSLFFVGMLSEFLKRYCYYVDRALVSSSATFLTVICFFIFLLLAWFEVINIDDKIYILFYSALKFFPLLGIILYFLLSERNRSNVKNSESLCIIVVDSLRAGGVFSIITIIYWITNQGFFIFFQKDIPAIELVQIRVTQNVFGIVTMLITLYDSLFLKKNINSDNKIFYSDKYLKFAFFALLLIIINYIILYVFSLTIYKDLDVFKYAPYLALSQFFYLLARMPILILKLRYNLSLILLLYIFSLVISICYLLLRQNSTDFIYIVQSIALANALVFIFSLTIAVKKERDYGKAY